MFRIRNILEIEKLSFDCTTLDKNNIVKCYVYSFCSGVTLSRKSNPEALQSLQQNDKKIFVER
jgi:hypothetical protein